MHRECFLVFLSIRFLLPKSEMRASESIPSGKIVVLSSDISSKHEGSRSRMSLITARNHRTYAKLNNYTLIHSTKLLDDSR